MKFLIVLAAKLCSLAPRNSTFKYLTIPHGILYKGARVAGQSNYQNCSD